VALLLALEGAALAAVPAEPVPGPLLLCTRVAVIHLALLVPALGAIPWLWSAYAGVVGAAVVAMSGYGHGPGEVAASIALVASAAACGAAAQRFARTRLYGASITGLLAVPYVCAYLMEEFGAAASAPAWRSLSPLDGPGTAAILLLWAWPVAAIAWRRRA